MAETFTVEQRPHLMRTRGAFVRKFRLTYPMLRDRDGDTQKRLGVTGYPQTLTVDRDGRIAGLHRGPVDDAFLRHTVLPLLTDTA